VKVDGVHIVGLAPPSTSTIAWDLAVDRRCDRPWKSFTVSSPWST
jgi:hypothetical protein